MGRYCVAARLIKKGEVILRESPLIVGPKMFTTPVCLGCMKKLSPLPSHTDYYKCSKCKWPMCSKACENDSWHRDECKVFQQANYCNDIRYVPGEEKRDSAYCVILPMRILHLKAVSQLLFNKIMTLESHLEQRQKSPLYQVLRLNLVRFVEMLLGKIEG